MTRRFPLGARSIWSRIVSIFTTGKLPSASLCMAAMCVMFACGGAITIWAQDPNGKKMGKGDKKEYKAPSDPEIYKLQESFVKDAEKLAKKYEKSNEISKAKDVYDEILKIVPTHPIALARAAELGQMESEANKVTMTLEANERWKDTGVNVIEGRPLRITASGKWRFKMDFETDPNGLKLPKEFKDFDLGALIGIIKSDGEEPKPFPVGSDRKFVPEKSGRLHLMMFHSDPKANEGSLSIEIQGTFEADKASSGGSSTKPKKKTGK